MSIFAVLAAAVLPTADSSVEAITVFLLAV